MNIVSNLLIRTLLQSTCTIYNTLSKHLKHIYSTMKDFHLAREMGPDTLTGREFYWDLSPVILLS